MLCVVLIDIVLLVEGVVVAVYVVMVRGAVVLVVVSTLAKCFDAGGGDVILLLIQLVQLSCYFPCFKLLLRSTDVFL